MRASERRKRAFGEPVSGRSKRRSRPGSGHQTVVAVASVPVLFLRARGFRLHDNFFAPGAGRPSIAPRRRKRGHEAITSFFFFYPRTRLSARHGPFAKRLVHRVRHLAGRRTFVASGRSVAPGEVAVPRDHGVANVSVSPCVSAPPRTLRRSVRAFPGTKRRT